MTIDPAILPGLLLIAAEFAALAAVGYVIVRAALRQDDARAALAQGLVVGPALWGLIVNFILYLVPGLAGAALGWGVVLALGAIVAWRARDRLRVSPRVVAAFVAAFLAIFWVALTTRQVMAVPDTAIHLGLAASIREGEFPPQLPWNPEMPVRYHHAPSLMVGLLTPSFMPDLGIVSRLLGVYAWTSLVLLVLTALAQRGSLLIGSALALFLLAASTWTSGPWTWTSEAEGILQVPIPSGLPAEGLRASLAGIYWPSLDTYPPAMLPDIWKPEFRLGYAVLWVVLERVAHAEGRSWPATVTVAALVGFLGLLVTTLVPVALVLWIGLEVWRLARTRREAAATDHRSGRLRAWISGALQPDTAWGLARAVAGLALAAVLLLGGGGAYTALLDGAGASGLLLEWDFEPGHWRALGTFDARPGGVALLGLGPVIVAGVAVLLARRDRLVVTLAAGVGLLLLAWLTVSFPPAPWDERRFLGHAHNLALGALLLALAMRLAQLRFTRWRYAVVALGVGLIAWPTLVEPVRVLGQTVANGARVAPAPPTISEPLATYIRDHTALDARVLSTEDPYDNVFLATGRPNAAGFVGVTHQIDHEGPEYTDAVTHLEPAALRRLGIDYVHATDAWAAGLPPRAQRWLADPDLFERLAADGGEVLYRVRPEFLALDAPPAPGSFEALRRAAPPSAVVYLAPQAPWLSRLHIASALSQARLVGDGAGYLLDRTPLPWSVAPLGGQTPDLVVLPASMEPWLFAPDGRLPVWHNDEIAVYSPDGAIAPIMPPPSRPDPVDFRVQLSDVRPADGRLAFAATFDNGSPGLWTGQDWVVVAVDDSPWSFPLTFGPDGRSPAVAAWFAGWLGSNVTTTTHTYEFDPRTLSLASPNREGEFTPTASSGAIEGTGDWVLAVRLRHEYEPGSWRDAAVVPVLGFSIFEDGGIVFEIFDDARGT